MDRETKGIVKWLIKENAIGHDERELYQYATNVIASTSLPLILAFLIGVSMGVSVNGFFIVVPFLLIRKFSGGFHTKHRWTCFLSSTIVLVICMLLSMFMRSNWVLHCIVAISICSLIVWSPVDSQNRRLEAGDKRRCKTVVVIFAILFGILYFILLGFHRNRIAVCIAIGIILAAVLQVPYVMQWLWKQMFGDRKRIFRFY